MRWQHPDELEADFQHYYGLDIAEVKPAKAARLLFQLPRNCRTFCAIEPANQWGWAEVFANKTTYLLEMLLWQAGTPNKKAERARHMAKKPKPFIPDFMKAALKPSAMNEGVEPMTVDDVKSWLAVPRTA